MTRETGAVELKPCPFCGVRLVRRRPPHKSFFHPLEPRASRVCIATSVIVDDSAESFRLWNTRPSLKIVPAEPIVFEDDSRPQPTPSATGEIERCPTCGATEKAPEPCWCSDGFHAPGETYWPVTSATREIVERLKRVRDMLAGHLMGHEANAVTDAIDAIDALEQQAATIAELRAGLEKCRDKFRAYARQHEAKARAANPGGSGRSADGEAKERWEKAARNREMAKECEATLERTRGQ